MSRSPSHRSCSSCKHKDRQIQDLQLNLQSLQQSVRIAVSSILKTSQDLEQIITPLDIRIHTFAAGNGHDVDVERKSKGKSDSKEEKKRSDRRKSPVSENNINNEKEHSSRNRNAVTSQSGTSSGSGSKAIGSKVLRVEKSGGRHEPKSPPHTPNASTSRSRNEFRLHDSPVDWIDDMAYHNEFDGRFSPQQHQHQENHIRDRTHVPHARSPPEPAPFDAVDDRRPIRSSRRREGSPMESDLNSSGAGDRKRARADRSPEPHSRRVVRSHSPAGRRVSDYTQQQQRSRSRSPAEARIRRELPINIYKFTAIRITNIYPQVSNQLLEARAARYGRVYQVEKKDREAIITFNDTEAPRRAIADMHDTVVQRISNFNDKLHVRFALGANQDKFHMRNVRKVECDECHFYRTTGCEDTNCPEKHIPFNSAIDLQPWMKKYAA